MSGKADALVELLQSKYGSGLRAVATYTRDGYEIHYAEDDVESNYSAVDIEEIYDDIVLHEITHDFQEELFSDMGKITGKMRLFNDGTVAHFWPSEDDSGLFLAFDDSVDPGVRELAELANSHYN